MIDWSNITQQGIDEGQVEHTVKMLESQFVDVLTLVHEGIARRRKDGKDIEASIADDLYRFLIQQYNETYEKAFKEWERRYDTQSQ